MNTPTPEFMTEKRRAAGILDISVPSQKIKALGVDNRRFHVFNILDENVGPVGRTRVPSDSIVSAFNFVASKLPAPKKWNHVAVGNSVLYTHSHDCPDGAKSLASSMTILKNTNQEERRQHYAALAEIDDIVKWEGKKHIQTPDVVTPLSLLRTDGGTDVQSCHLDDLRTNIKAGTSLEGCSAIIAASQAGSYLLVFPHVQMETLDQDTSTVRGTMIFIPFGWCVIFRHSVLHAGGFRSLDDVSYGQGNLRFFYYITPAGMNPPEGNLNANTSGKLFSEYFLNPLDVTKMQSVFHYE